MLDRYLKSEGQLDLFEDELQQERYFRRVAVAVTILILALVFGVPMLA